MNPTSTVRHGWTLFILGALLYALCPAPPQLYQIDFSRYAKLAEPSSRSERRRNRRGEFQPI
jgi:hypothetical protein